MPTLLAYLLSFFFIAIYWVNHHQIFHDAEQVNIKILWCNMVWLFVMSFIPFATARVGTYPKSWVPITLYFADMSIESILFHILYYLIFKESHKGEKYKLSLRSVISLIVYLAAAWLGGFCPIAAFIIVAAVSLWWIAPAKKQSDIKR